MDLAGDDVCVNEDAGPNNAAHDQHGGVEQTHSPKQANRRGIRTF
jgi:hypothetical protein